MLGDIWMGCDDLEAMLACLGEGFGEKLSQRKTRPFICACCRRIWGKLTDPDACQEIEVGERFAEGQVSQDNLLAASDLALDAADKEGGDETPTFAVTLRPTHHATGIAAGHVRGTVGTDARREELVQVRLLRCIFGNPFSRVPPPDPTWLMWQGGTVRKLAEAIYGTRALPRGTLDPGQMRILADALEEAGCDKTEILAHCRDSGEHALGCWVVDWVLGRG